MKEMLRSDSYLIDSENRFLQNAVESIDMTTQRKTENGSVINEKNKKSKTWTVTRSYSNKFSCYVAVERLIQVHHEND